MIPIILLTIEDESSRELLLRLYEEGKNMMYSEAKRYFTSEADIEDAISEAVIKLVDKVDVLQQIEESKRIPYAVSTVRHTAYHILEHRKRLSVCDYDDLANALPTPESDDPEERIIEAQRNQRMKEILESVPPEERLLLEKKYVLFWSDAEIAAQLGIKIESVRMRFTRAKRKIAKALLKKGFSLDEWNEL